MAGTLGCAKDDASPACGNVFSAITSTGGNAYGLYVNGTFGGANASIRHNTFNVTSNSTSPADKAYGMYFELQLAAVDAVKIQDNKLLVTTGRDNLKAFGFRLADRTGQTELAAAGNNNRFARSLDASQLQLIEGINDPEGATCVVGDGDC